jgi:HD-GYP domain-containing protein (c-di-GMP phosphodiesterase class II)
MVLRPRGRGRVGRRRHPFERVTFTGGPLVFRLCAIFALVVRVHRLLLTSAGALAGAAIAHANHRRRRAERLAAATFETLLNAIDANDAVTGAHVRRVAAYADILSSAMGLGAHRRREIERVALFHDIGKLHAALFDIIHDRSSLTPAERRAVATHPRRGADVLDPLATFYPKLAEGVLAHHERWDGKGYPRRLRGERIPLSSRVVALADTFDAITAPRRYHRGENITKALGVIREGRGAQFDPQLTDVFLREDVVQQLTAAMHDAHATAKRRSRPNRRRSVERGAPDVSFRWRDRIFGPQAAPAAP